ncbi:hypothetical protein IKF32_00180 [Candidatus Saccharibacteria bacterium]|nr:hypothetical protein [Candidatus Saccharibacteria bacterium]
MDDKRNVVGFAIIAFILLVIAIIVWFFLNGRETYISDETESDAYLGLDCTADNPTDGFFYSQVANSATNHIKVTFVNNKIYKMYYSYEGTYRSNDVALQEETNFHIKYDEHMGSYGLVNSILTPTYSTAKTKMQINLYAKNRDVINKGTAVFFFVDEDDVESFHDFSRDDLANYYSKKSFSCTKQN